MIQNLAVVWDFDPVMFSLGSLEIRYYGLMWALALLLGGWFFGNFCKREKLNPELADSIFIYGALATVIGARVGHCLFYEPDYYLLKPWAILTEIRNGGMASHGAAIGMLLGMWITARKHNMPYVWWLDRIMIPVSIGGGLVRLGNLCNSEIVGSVTDVPWGFKFVRLYNLPIADVPVLHPAQLYEAICYFITFGILMWFYYKKDVARKRAGVMFGIGLLGIFLTRFFIEIIKKDQEAFEADMLLNMGQLLSLPFIAMAIYVLWRAAKGSFPIGLPATKQRNTNNSKTKHK